MKTIVGIFNTRTDAERAADALQSIGIPKSNITVITPGTRQELSRVPITETEQPGLGKVIGGVVGGAFGATAGAEVGAALATIFIPGVGPVLVSGLLGAALFGTGGALGGMAAGEALEGSLDHGLPKDELYVYEDALRHNRSVVIALTNEDHLAEAARHALTKTGAESVDTARQRWWLGLRPAEEQEYLAHGGADFKSDERNYRLGFEAALSVRDRSHQEAQQLLRERYPMESKTEAFRRGYERGHAYDKNRRAGTSS